MRRFYPREKVQIAFAGFVAALGAAALLFFLVLYLPLRAEYRAAGETIARLTAETAARRAALDRMEAAADGIDLAGEHWSRFLRERLITRDQGYAAMIPDLEGLARFAGVSRDRVNYNLIEESQFGVYAVVINMPIRNSYDSLTRFIEELENAETFFILDSILLSRPDVEDDTDLNLELNLTTFFSEQP